MAYTSFSGQSLGRGHKGILIISLRSDYQLPHYLCASTDAQKCKFTYNGEVGVADDFPHVL